MLEYAALKRHNVFAVTVESGTHLNNNLKIAFSFELPGETPIDG
jgi:hypothetical protein